MTSTLPGVIGEQDCLKKNMDIPCCYKRAKVYSVSVRRRKNEKKYFFYSEPVIKITKNVGDFV